MKVLRTEKFSYKLLKFKLIKTKIYKTDKKNFIKIDDTIIRLRKALHVIYKFHMNNKKILFIGGSTNTPIKKLLLGTRHSIIPESLWINGIINNRADCFKYLSNSQKFSTKKVSDLLVSINKQSDLIVILDSKSNQSAISEGYLARIPIIAINSELGLLNNKPTYKIPGDFQFTIKKIRDILFYSLLFAIFKKAKKDLKKQPKKKQSFAKTKNKRFFQFKKKRTKF